MAKTAIVTGASRGIGREIARRLGAHGFAVVVNYAGSAANAEEAASEIRSAGGKAITSRQMSTTKAKRLTSLSTPRPRSVKSIWLFITRESCCCLRLASRSTSRASCPFLPAPTGVG